MIEHYREILRRVYGGRKWIVATGPLAGMRGLVERLRELGVKEVLCVAASRGTGDLPDSDFAPDPIVFDVRGEDMMSGIRASMQKLANLPPDAVEQVEAFDAERGVRVIGTIFDDGSPLGGRPKYGARPESWQRLEDKTTVDRLWDAVGVSRSESIVLSADDREALSAAARELDEGAGTVWVADNREGFHGGGSFTRHVETEGEAATVGEFLSQHADRIRVMPFLEGLPCSIHGFVFEARTIALRPCEMLVFRKADSTEFHYGKAATFWDPVPADRDAMRSVACRVGDHLREHFDYRGAFTVDGVMTADGFRPTELNPRFGAALGVMTRALDLDLMLLNLAIVEGEPYDWRPEQLERLLVETADDNRAGGTMAISTTRFEETSRTELRFVDGEFRRANGAPVDATATVGPSPAGSFLSVDFDAERTPAGPSVASRAVAALRWADEEFGLELGRLVPAADVRSERVTSE